MKRIDLCAAVLSLLGVSFVPADHASAQLIVSDELNPTFEAAAQENSIVFELFPDVAVSDVSPQLINGAVVNPRDFRGIARMTTGGTCTAALIGPAVLLTAAHCVGNGQQIKFVVAGISIDATCTHAPGYDPFFKPSDDLALCLLSRTVTGLTYETVKLDTVPIIGSEILLTGYGCTTQNGGIDGRLRVGRTETVTDQEASDAATNFNVPLGEVNSIYTLSDVPAGGAVICPGDSGGPAFEAGLDPKGPRKIVGVNSRTTFNDGVSILAAVATADGAAFIRDWADANGQSVCGDDLTLGCK